MTVREVLEIAREAAVKIRQIEEQAEIRRQSIGVQGHNSFEVHAKTGVLDPMRHVVELLDWQERLIEEPDLYAPIEEAYEIMAGIERQTDDVTTEVLMRYYLQGESLKEIVDGWERGGMRYPPIGSRVEQLRHVPRSKQFTLLQKVMDLAISEMDKIGIARLKQLGNE